MDSKVTQPSSDHHPKQALTDHQSDSSHSMHRDQGHYRLEESHRGNTTIEPTPPKTHNLPDPCNRFDHAPPPSNEDPDANIQDECIDKSEASEPAPPPEATWTIDRIFSTYPQHNQEIAQLLTAAGLSCVGCSAATWETLEAGVFSHGKSRQALEEILAGLRAIVQRKIDPTTITLTPYAAQKFREYACKEGKEAWGVRFSDKAGGCGGFEYLLDFQEAPSEGDIIFVSEGIEIFVKETSLSRLQGAYIDYQDGLYGAGFKISNPNAKSSCSCGTSHNY